MRHKLLTALLALGTSLPAAAERIVTLTPDVADIVVALGAASDVVGRNSASHQSELAHATPIGLSRSLNPEPVARLKPTLVLGSQMAQPGTLFDTLEKLGIRAHRIGNRDDGSDYAQSITRIGQLLGKSAESARLSARWQEQMKPQPPIGTRYLLSYDGKLVAGRNTAADTLIRATGGINAAAELDGFKPVSREAWTRLKPDVIVLAAHNEGLFGGIDAFARRPEVAPTNAAKQGKIVAWPAEQFLRIGLDSPATVTRLRKLGQ